MKQTTEHVPAMGTTNLPEKTFRVGPISATIWKNNGLRPNGEISQFNTISLERSYKDDKSGEWKKTNSFRISDLPKVTLVAQKSFEYISLKGNEAEVSY